ncbi:hypothetical protein [Corynebacterium striatum]|uniref:hypothetical protein n=1 Tax=Corynebacterium striatum TaxID=43770 RepID=UPI0027BB121D|nr:hypothetical protein [Corynebacterium striatum]
MTNPTREDIIAANNALSALVCVALSNTADPDEKDWIRTIARKLTAALPPKPQPTMAEVEWDKDKHYLAEAKHPEYGRVIMVGKNFFFGRIRIMSTKEKDALWILAEPESLTPTGRRYTLTEVQE